MTGSVRTAICALVLPAALVSPLAGCGGGQETEQDRVRETVNDLARAFVDRDARAACESLTFNAQQQAGSAGHGSPSLCPRDVRRAWKYMRDERAGGYARQPGVTAVAVDGDRATATIAPARGATARLGMVRDDGRWKLDSFYGARATTRGDATPPRRAGGRAVKPSDASGRPCATVDARDTAAIRGGCGIAATGTVTLTVRTAFGSFEFASCDARLVIRVDRQGRTWTKPLGISNNGVCGDVDFCIDRRNVRRPWLGRIQRRGAGLQHQVAVCFRTCIGQFEGDVTMALRPQGDGWRLEATDQEVGDGGLEIDGNWQVRAPAPAFQA